MALPKMHFLLATFLLISEAYSQLVSNGYVSPQRSGAATSCIMNGDQFIVPCVIKPLIPKTAPACYAPKQQAPSPAPVQCADNDDEELERMICLLISSLIENRKGSSKKQSSSGGYNDCSVCPSDGYDACTYGFNDDYDYNTYTTPPASSGSPCPGSEGVRGCENNCPEISVYIRPYNECC